MEISAKDVRIQGIATKTLSWRLSGMSEADISKALQSQGAAPDEIAAGMAIGLKASSVYQAPAAAFPIDLGVLLGMGSLAMFLIGGTLRKLSFPVGVAGAAYYYLKGKKS